MVIRMTLMTKMSTMTRMTTTRMMTVMTVMKKITRNGYRWAIIGNDRQWCACKVYEILMSTEFRRDVRLSKELILGAREMLDNVLFLRQQLLKAVEARRQKDPHGAKRCPKNIELKHSQTIRTFLKILELRVLFCAGRRSQRQIRFFLFFQNTFKTL